MNRKQHRLEILNDGFKYCNTLLMVLLINENQRYQTSFLKNWELKCFLFLVIKV